MIRHGNPCVRCGSTERYRKGGKCVPCSRRVTAAHHAREASESRHGTQTGKCEVTARDADRLCFACRKPLAPGREMFCAPCRDAAYRLIRMPHEETMAAIARAEAEAKGEAR